MGGGTFCHCEGNFYKNIGGGGLFFVVDHLHKQLSHVTQGPRVTHLLTDQLEMVVNVSQTVKGISPLQWLTKNGDSGLKLCCEGSFVR